MKYEIVHGRSIPKIGFGMWRIGGGSYPDPSLDSASMTAIRTALEAGYTHFDTAEAYAAGHSEELLGRAIRETGTPGETLFITTKISPEHLAYEQIFRSCEKSLRRLQLDHIDLYLLHRPDYLADPEEVAAAFSQLRQAGKVRHFGVSNFRPLLLTALQVACPMPLVVHQIEISLARLDAFTDGTLDQCLIEKVTPMAWSPLAGGQLGRGATRLLPSQQNYRVEAINSVLDEIARSRGVSRIVIALAWLLQKQPVTAPIIGATKISHLEAAVGALSVKLTQEEVAYLEAPYVPHPIVGHQ